MSLEISSVTGETTIAGVTQPTIGQRRIDHEVRLADGEINLIGGILQDTEAKSMSGWPLLTKIPILKYLFGQESKQRQDSEIVFAVVPHIVRSTPVTDEDLRMVDLGSGSTVKYRAQEGKTDVAATGTQPAAQEPKSPVQQNVPAAAPRAQ
jgi:general secretion pathway protein D